MTMRQLKDGESVDCEGCAQGGVGRAATGWCEDGLPWCDECGRWNKNIGQAVAMLKQGQRVTRPGWNGRGMYLYLVPGEYKATGSNVAPFVMMHPASGDDVPWLCSQSDLLATDWMGTDDH